MNPHGPTGSWTAVSIAAVLALGGYAAFGDIGINFWDEGFLWYGATQTAAGQVPIRDFQSYDLGRYYWSAAGLLAFGDGILGLRLSLALFQALGLACGLLAARRISSSPVFLASVGVLLVAWMFPRHKLFEPSLALMGVFFAVRLLEDPSPRRHLASGLFIGIAAVLGRNHGLYNALGHLLVVALVQTRGAAGQPARNLVSLGSGIVAGFSPILGLCLLDPLFADRFYASLWAFRPMPRPVPWPWRVTFDPALGLPLALTPVAVSLAYVVMAVAYPLGLWVAWRTPSERLAARSLLVACACVGVFYSHHAFSRASLAHLAQASPPFLLGLLAAPPAFGASLRSRRNLAAWAGTLVLTVPIAAGGFRLPLSAWGLPIGPPIRFETYDVTGDSLWLPRSDAETLRRTEAVLSVRLDPSEPLLVLPFRPTYYPVLGRRSPVWTIYFLAPGRVESDEEIIRKLEEEEVDWVLFVSEILKGVPRDFGDLRPGLDRYLEHHFQPVVRRGLPGGHVLLHRRGFVLPDFRSGDEGG